jgi:hypothetical protein
MSKLRDRKIDVDRYDTDDDREDGGKRAAQDAEVLRHFRIFKPPSAGFNAMTASDRELSVHGLPPRPNESTHPKLAAKWRRVADRHLEYITPELRVNHSMRRGRLRNLTAKDEIPESELERFRDLVANPYTSDTFDTRKIDFRTFFPETSTNWSGAYVKRPKAEPLVSVTGEWTVPGVNPPSSAWNGKGYNDGTYLCGVWVGIDGTQGTNDVMQAGTGSLCVVSGGKMTSTSFFAWTEWFSLLSVTVANYPVQVGDLISCTVCAPFGATHGTAMFNNLTTGATTSIGINPPAGVSLAGNVAEWIVEDPSTSANVPFPFPNYGSTHFYDCTAGSKNIELDLGSGTMIDLVDAKNNVISSALIETNRTLFCHYGPF